jgi:hypothetical protein
VPTVPPARVLVVTLGDGVTTTVDDIDLVMSATEVATIVTVILAETVAGAL